MPPAPDWLGGGVCVVALFAASALGALLAWLKYRGEIRFWKSQARPDKGETPKAFRERTGFALPLDAAVFCRWKKDGPTHRKLKSLYEEGISPDPDNWSAHLYAEALGLGDAHGEQMEILCAGSGLERPPPDEAGWQ